MSGSVFENVVCGVDDSDAGLAAARIAGRVTAPGGRLKLLSIVHSAQAVHAGYAATPVLARLEREAQEAVDRARAAIELEGEVVTELVSGSPLRVLDSTIDREGATLVVVGRHGRSRAAGIALGSVATHLLHGAPCSVLVTPAAELDDWPRSIVVGSDGSACARRAVAAAVELGRRLSASVRVLVATGDGAVDLAAAREAAPELEEHAGKPVDVLVGASAEADLVVLGNRGLQGLKALGSVGERVAHGARCPVLVVRNSR
ncbi:MAG: universal stress protein [Gaiellaceae bacterium]|jgi:nucleotide-binding universal stress UspA family protein|nr:universal stress protein [Gaiellaceae bacterium]